MTCGRRPGGQDRLGIRDVLLPALRRRFPGLGMTTGHPPDPIAVFPAKHPEVGDLLIWDNGDEVTIAVGKISHGHYGTYDDDTSLKPGRMEEEVTDFVVQFLEELFADRVLILTSPRGRGDGWGPYVDNERSFLDKDALAFVWSGPVPNPRAGR